MQRSLNKTPSLSLSTLGAALLAASLGGACAESGTGGIIFQSRNTTASAASTSIVRVSERWVLWQADEFTTGPAGTDLNGDGDTIDLVAFVVEMATKKETNLGVAADDLLILGEGTGPQLLLVVTEGTDDTDWNTDGDKNDVVLLNVPGITVATATPTPVATLVSNNNALVEASGRVYFVEDETAGAALAIGETAINYVELDGMGGLVPPMRVLQSVVDPLTLNPLVDVLAEPVLVGADGDLVFFTMDETIEEPVGGGGPGVNLNGGLAGLDDIDLVDQHVLGVFDASDPASVALGLSLAVETDLEPLRVIETGTPQAPDKLLAFLVSEADQNDTNLNVVGAPDLPGGWLPAQCTADDADTLDTVLFYLEWEAWLADPLLNRAKNTGLSGRARVLAIPNGNKLFVATVSSELEAECDLNDDTDLDDEVFRYAPVGGGTAFVTTPEALLAVEAVDGGVEGVTDLDERFLAVISEADNDEEFNGDDPGDPGYKVDDLIAWLNPGAVTNSTPFPWIFDHSPNQGIQAGGCDWMTERPERDRMPVTYQESVHGSSINLDMDTLDSMPSFARFSPIDDLDFPGPPVAVRAGNAGIAIANNIGFYRVDENADDRDWNNDGDKTDMVLFRTTVSSLQNSNYLNELNNLSRPAVELNGTIGAAYLADEAMGDEDYNGDGDQTDLVLRWFRIG